jgi:hypothetical protein
MVVGPERRLESNAVIWLKSMGAWVFKLGAVPGVPTGAPDRGFFYKDKWGVIEFKRSATAPFQPGQKPTLEHLREGNQFVYVAYPENWLDIKQDLLDNFFV